MQRHDMHAVTWRSNQTSSRRDLEEPPAPSLIDLHLVSLQGPLLQYITPEPAFFNVHQSPAECLSSLGKCRRNLESFDDGKIIKLSDAHFPVTQLMGLSRNRVRVRRESTINIYGRAMRSGAARLSFALLPALRLAGLSWIKHHSLRSSFHPHPGRPP